MLCLNKVKFSQWYVFINTDCNHVLESIYVYSTIFQICPITIMNKRLKVYQAAILSSEADTARV